LQAGGRRFDPVWLHQTQPDRIPPLRRIAGGRATPPTMNHEKPMIMKPTMKLVRENFYRRARDFIAGRARYLTS
jgi:hypothetical protein